MINLGIGLKWQFYRNPRIAIGVTVVPEIGFITCTENSYDSSFANNNLYTNGVFMGKEQIYSQEIRADDAQRYRVRVRPGRHG